MNIEFAKEILKVKSREKSPIFRLKIDWFGFDLQADLSRKKLFVQIDTSKPSKLTRFSFLPRTSASLRLDNSQFSFKSAPLIETLSNVGPNKLSWKQLNQVAQTQLSEIKLSTPAYPKLRSGQSTRPSRTGTAQSVH